MRLFKYFWLFSPLVSYPVTANEQLLFIVSYPGSAPYLYQQTGDDTFLGIIPDMLNPLMKTKQFDIRFISNSRKRSEEYLYQGKADLMLISPSWLSSPEKLIATIPLHQHRSYLYQTEKFSNDFSLDKLEASKSVCTRKGFVYPNLEPYFINNQLMRIDSSSQTTTLSMLFKKRCDLVILSEYHALTIMKLDLFKNKKLFRSDNPISIVPLNIVLRPELNHVKTILDEHIRKLIRSGELESIINKYIH
ncbi:MAG: transporter substrate-binding domain-containing protein [Colwellia sp.]|nr:transporter substrate-binding domain-containing protein [Colwellia sp.]